MPLLTTFLASCFLLGDRPADRQFHDRTTVFGSCANDEIKTKEYAVYLNARGGNDTVIDASPANNVIQAGTGNDTIYAGGGNDALFGGPGYDAFIFEGDFGQDIIVDFNTSRYDWIGFVVYSEDTLSPEAILNQHARQDGQDVVIDLNGVGAFGSGKLRLNQTNLQKLRPRNFQIIISDPG